MKKNVITTYISAAALASALLVPSVYASGVDNLVNIFTEIEDGGTAPELPPEQLVAENTIEGVWDILETKIPFTFKAGKAPSVLTTVSGILEKALVPITNLLKENAINNGDYIEYLTYLPPNFNDNSFSIAAYDVYNTKGVFTGDLHSESNDVLFQVKIYPEFSANSPIIYELKNLENIHIPVDGNSQNLVLEFYSADGSKLIDSMVLPAKKNNKDYGITLAKTKDKSHIYYLKKEARHHVTNTYTIDKLMDPLYEYPALNDTEKVEERLANMEPRSRAASFEHFVWKKARQSSKVEISSHPEFFDGRVYSGRYIISQWQNPKWLIRGNSTYHYGESYYSDFTNNANTTTERGLMLKEGGSATYQLYIPEEGTYSFSFHLTNSEEQQVTINNPLTGESLYNVTLPESSDGNPQGHYTKKVNLDLKEGLLFLDVNASNVQVDGIAYQFIVNKDEQNQEYLERKHETIRLSLLNAEFYLNEGNARPLTQEAVEKGLSHANFLLSTTIIPNINDLTVRGYAHTDPLMLDINDKVVDLESNIQVTNKNLNFTQTGMITIEGENNSYGTGTQLMGEFLRFEKSSQTFQPLATYNVYIPEEGDYSFSYSVAKDNNLDGEGFSIDNMFSDLETIAIDTVQKDFVTLQGGTFHLEEGDTMFYVYGEATRFDLDKIKLHYKN